MQISVWPDPSRPVDEVLDLARFVDGGGWYGIWYADHYMPNTGSEEIRAGDMHECWAVLPAIAAVTSRVRLGPLVSPTSVHHPAVLANRAATLDHLSGGRFVLGLGAGWQINEHHAYGIELEPPGRRVSRFEEAIRIVRSLLDRDRTTYVGDVYRITDAPMDPKPVQARLPILVGTGSPRMLRITARHAQEWNTWGAPELAATRRAAFTAACDSVGTDPASLHTSVQALVVMDAAAPASGSEPDDRMIVGSDEQLVDALGRYRDLGFDEFIVPDWNMRGDVAARHEQLQRFFDLAARH